MTASKTVTDLDKEREFRFLLDEDENGMLRSLPVVCSPRELLSKFTKDEIVEYLIQTGVLQ